MFTIYSPQKARNDTMEQIEQLLDQAMKPISDTEMMRVASQLASLKQFSQINQAMSKRCETAEGQEKMQQLRSCFLQFFP